MCAGVVTTGSESLQRSAGGAAETFDLCPLLILPHPPLPSAPPTSLALSGTAGGGAKKRLVAPSLSLTLSGRDSHDLSSDGFTAAALSATPDEALSLDINLEALETPSDSETGTLPDSLHDLEWEGETGLPSPW